jgi:hypothetical protein
MALWLDTMYEAGRQNAARAPVARDPQGHVRGRMGVGGNRKREAPGHGRGCGRLSWGWQVWRGCLTVGLRKRRTRPYVGIQVGSYSRVPNGTTHFIFYVVWLHLGHQSVAKRRKRMREADRTPPDT